uniref:PHD-type domain-containing protein n=1 Tax=Panagrolaimus superbus TaxID=310955 RepID=A0A914YVF8_9BILA
MSERQQMSKALKESMETANMVPSTSSSSRSDRHSYEQRIAKKKRPEKDKLLGEKKSKNANPSLSSSSVPPPPSLPPQISTPPPAQMPLNEPPPKLEAAAPTAEKEDDEEDEKWWCPMCGLRYVDGDNMVMCEKCKYWYHWSCVGIVVEPQEEQWYCERCKEALKKEKGSKK